MAEQEILHRQSREAWERRSTELESANKRYLIRLTKLLDEKGALMLALTDEMNTALLMAVQLRGENSFLWAKNHELKKEGDEAFESVKGALNEVIDTSKSWAVKAFKMLAESDNVLHYKCRLEFQESLQRATIADEELLVYQDSLDDKEEEEVVDPLT